MPAPGLADPRTGYRSAQDLVFTPSSSQAPCALRGADGGTVGGSAYDCILFQFLMVVEVVSVSEVFKVSQDRVQQRIVEQISQQRLPSRTLTFQFRVVTELFILHRRLPVCRVRQIKGFSHFSRKKKRDVGSALGVGTAPRVEPIHAGCSVGGLRRVGTALGETRWQDVLLEQKC